MFWGAKQEIRNVSSPSSQPDLLLITVIKELWFVASLRCLVFGMRRVLSEDMFDSSADVCDLDMGGIY